MKRLHRQLGFTMIELLIVITILGILAVAVLSAINPIEQINRGRDTGRQSDAEQLLSAIDRYNAFQGYFPWQIDANDPNIAIMDADGYPVPVTETTPAVGGVPEEPTPNIVLNGGGMFGWLVGDVFAQEDPPATGCPILTRLSTGSEGVANCAGAQELKESFTRRVASGAGRTLYLYNNGLPGASTYVCFVPQSGAFDTQALERCADPAEPGEDYTYGVGLPVDIEEAAANFICNPTETFDGLKDVPGAMVCLP